MNAGEIKGRVMFAGKAATQVLHQIAGEPETNPMVPVLSLCGRWGHAPVYPDNVVDWPVCKRCCAVAAGLGVTP